MQVCATTTFSADTTVYAGAPLLLDTWISLGAIDLTSVVPTLYSFDIPVIGGEGGGVIGGEGGGVLGPD